MTYTKLIAYVIFLAFIGFVTLVTLPITIPFTVLYMIGDAVYGLIPKKPKKDGVLNNRRATY